MKWKYLLCFGGCTDLSDLILKSLVYVYHTCIADSHALIS